MSFNINAPLLEFKGEAENTTITLKDACSGIFIVGATGSGKSSGSCKTLALNFLSQGCGGLVLSVKQEAETWKEYCRITGREKDLLILKPGGEHSFNFLEYESSQNLETTFVSNLVTLLNNVIQTNKEKKEGRGDDPFWANSLMLLMHNTISLCMLHAEKVTLPMLYDIALSITDTDPDSAFNKALKKASEKTAKQIDAWAQKTGNEYLASLDDVSYNTILFEAIPDARQLRLINQFFIGHFRKLNEKTRSIVELSFIGFLFNLLQEPVYSLFCSKSCTFSPESSFLDKKIILLDLPTKIYGQVGHYVQSIFKEIWQRAMERRDVKANNSVVFLWSDECQELLTENDSKFLATARSSLVSSIFISQNLPLLYSCVSGEKSEHKIKGLLGNFCTKIMHCNTDVETNSWAASMIGSAWQKDDTETITTSNGTTSTSTTVSVKLQQMVRPEAFSGLATGDKTNHLRVGAYIHVQGKKFSSGFSHLLINFKQDYQPKPKN